MVDFDLTKMDYWLRIGSSIENYNCEMALQSDDSGEAVIIRTKDNKHAGSQTELAVDKKAARMIVNYLQTIFDL